MGIDVGDDRVWVREASRFVLVCKVCGAESESGSSTLDRAVKLAEDDGWYHDSDFTLCPAHAKESSDD
jgi:hypothetical protein